MRIRISKEDRVFSLIIRYRDDWTCQVCKRQFEVGSGKLSCSHFFGRRNKGTRWDEMNACAKCFTCHQYMGENPVHFSDWIKARLGEQKYLDLMRRAHSVTKFTTADMAFLYADMKKRLAGLKMEYER